MNEFVQSLLLLLDEPDTNIVRYAVDALKGFPEREVEETLLSKLSEGIPEVVDVIVGTLFVHHAGHEDRLLERLLAHEDDLVRFQAVVQAADLMTAATVAPLLRLLETEPTAPTRAAVLGLLVRFPEQVGPEVACRFLDDPDDRVRANAVELLSLLGGGAHGPELDRLTADPSPRVRANAMRCLWQLHREEYVQRIRAELASDDVERILSAVYLLGFLPDFPDGEALLADHMRNPDGQVRMQAAQALLHRAGPIEVGAWIRYYLDEEDPRIRGVLLRIMTRTGTRETMVELGRILADPAADVRARATAARCLGENGDPEAVPSLLAQLGAEDPRLRANVVEALGRHRSPHLVDVLLPSLADPHPRVAANAAVAVWKQGGRDVVKRLSEQLAHRDPGIQASAIYALGEIGMVEFVEPLSELLDHVSSTVVMTDSQKRLQQNILRALEKIRSRSPQP